MSEAMMTLEPTQKALGAAELADLMRDFTQAAQEWTSLYARMQGEVARLRREVEEKDELLKSRERLAALGQMAAGVAHEIRNPLGGIQLYANLLERSLSDRPQDRAIVEKILSGVGHMERIVQQTLTFAGGICPRLKPVDLAEAVASALDSCGLSGKGVSVRVRLAVPAGTFVEADADLLLQVLSNLLLNARDAMAGTGELSVSARTEGAFVRIEVADSGPGIPAELRSRIFDPFVTTKASGVGLGLSVVWRILEAHRGTIRLDAESPRGARFILSWPAAQRGAA